MMKAYRFKAQDEDGEYYSVMYANSEEEAKELIEEETLEFDWFCEFEIELDEPKVLMIASYDT